MTMTSSEVGDRIAQAPVFADTRKHDVRMTNRCSRLISFEVLPHYRAMTTSKPSGRLKHVTQDFFVVDDENAHVQLSPSTLSQPVIPLSAFRSHQVVRG